MAEQVPYEQNDFFLPDVFIEEVILEIQPLPFRADRDSGNHRNLIPPIDMTMNRSLPHGCPGFDDVGNEEESALIDEHYVGAQPSSFFFIRGHCWRFHCSTSFSSRSTARRSGF
jgi:hypothetical protein